MSIRTIKPSELTDDMRVVRIVNRFGSEEFIYDDSWGPLFVYRCSIATLGYVRARSWEDAWSITEDEILDDAEWADIEESAGVAIEPTVDGRFMVLVDGLQWGPRGSTRDMSGAANATFDTENDARSAFWEEESLPEGYGYRPNGASTSALGLKSPYYSEDLNGSSLDQVSDAFAEDCGITIYVEVEDEDNANDFPCWILGWCGHSKR